ncbi:MAG: flagellar hook-length control protein FliK [Sterolibacterium sp.]|nr:flagellar hook-length control protein FliK [Sterolibacterium sp.]
MPESALLPSFAASSAAPPKTASRYSSGNASATTAGLAARNDAPAKESGNGSFASVLKRQTNQAAPSVRSSSSSSPAPSSSPANAEPASTPPPTDGAAPIAEAARSAQTATATPFAPRIPLLAAAAAEADEAHAARPLTLVALLNHSTDERPADEIAVAATDSAASPSTAVAMTAEAGTDLSPKIPVTQHSTITPDTTRASEATSRAESRDDDSSTLTDAAAVTALMAFFAPATPATAPQRTDRNPDETLARSLPLAANPRASDNDPNNIPRLLPEKHDSAAAGSDENRHDDTAAEFAAQQPLTAATERPAASTSGNSSKSSNIASLSATPLDAALAQGKENGATTGEIRFDQTLQAAQTAHTAHTASSGLGALNETGLRGANHAEVPLKIETPVGTRGWEHEVGDKLVWMAGRQEQRAELVLNPPQLGRVEVSIHLKGDQASATFVAANPIVREALAEALPRLREMFADAGLSLGQAHVGADSGRNHPEQSAANWENREDSSRFSGALEPLTDGNMSHLNGSPSWPRQGRGLVDTFA